MVLCIATFLPLWRHGHWLVRGWDFPRLQIACVAAVILCLHLLTLQTHDVIAWLALLLAALCLIWQVSWILPYTELWPKEVAAPADPDSDTPGVSILTANVLMPNRNAAGLVALVKEHRPDILVTLETDAWWQTQLDVLEGDVPHTVKCPQDNVYGMHVYSRLPFLSCKTVFLVEEDVPSVHLAVALPDADVTVQLHFLHPAPPSPTENAHSTERDAELIVVAKTLCGSNDPIIVAGDLNDVAWSYTTRLFRKISGLLDPRVGRGMFNTFHAQYWFLRWPLDHLFHSRHFTVRSIKRLPANGSDHFSLLTELVYAPQTNDNETPLPVDSEDHQAARTIVADNVNDKISAPRLNMVSLSDEQSAANIIDK